MWPAALIIGMFVLIGAIGTTTAPTANAAAGDAVCDILGPFPSGHGGAGEGYDNNLLIVGQEYLFLGLVTTATTGSTALHSIAIDDQGGNADLTRVGVDLLGDGATTANSVDTALPGSPHEIDSVDNWILDSADAVIAFEWDDAVISDFTEDLEDEFTAAEATTADTLGEIVDLASNAAADNCGATDVAVSIFAIECDDEGDFEITFWETGTNNSRSEDYHCASVPTTITLTPSPATVESHPARGNVSHSLILAVVTDASGDPVAEGYTVDWSTDKCTIDGLSEFEYESGDGYKALFAAYKSTLPATAAAIEDLLTGHAGLTGKSTSATFLHDSSPAPGFQTQTRAAAVLHCEGVDPGTATVTAEIEDDQELLNVEMGPSTSIEGTTTVTVVGPPAFITMVAEPTSLVCGEKSQILITVTDALNQNVSDHTVIELITNYGGVIGGTGSSLGLPGVNPVNPLSSSATETYNGVATAFLLTSTNHIGSYEVVAATGGSYLGTYNVSWSFGPDTVEEEEVFETDSGTFDGQTGQFSTAVLTNQVTVVCTEGAAPDVTAPDTGTGTISPPNTGDAGLASRSAGTASLFVIAGAVAFVLAGFAKFGFARR